jgi:hypothetical protein
MQQDWLNVCGFSFKHFKKLPGRHTENNTKSIHSTDMSVGIYSLGYSIGERERGLFLAEGRSFPPPAVSTQALETGALSPGATQCEREADPLSSAKVKNAGIARPLCQDAFTACSLFTIIMHKRYPFLYKETECWNRVN